LRSTPRFLKRTPQTAAPLEQPVWHPLIQKPRPPHEGAPPRTGLHEEITMPRKPRARVYTEQLKQLDRVAGDLNVVLVMFAIGLATLDLTFVASQRVLDHLPELTGATLIDGSSTAPNTAAGWAKFQ
jgi:hypothetical protein